MFDVKTTRSIAKTARDLDVPAAALLAVAEVESGGRTHARVNGRDEPLIRFEGHYFHRLLTGDARRRAVSAGMASPKAGAVKNPRAQAARWSLLERAIAIDRVAALSSVSWGLGQVMGSHWRWLGYGSVDAMVFEARQGAAGQVAVMARFIDKAGLADLLRKRDWAGFARRYNGPAYAKNRYDKRMAQAYKRHAKTTDGALAADKSLPDPAREPLKQTNDLRFGARGPAVRDLQRRLAKAGYLLVADGLFGLKTDAMLREFQRDNGLAESGVAGKAEVALLEKRSNGSRLSRLFAPIRRQVSALRRMLRRDN